MEVSVIIPTYRPKGYLWECLESVEAQSFDHARFEAIVVLNGFREPYYSMISDFIDHSNANIRLLYSESAGVSGARNMAIESARGRYITFLDDDDYISEGFLEEMVSAARCTAMPVSCLRSFDDATGEGVEGRISRFYDKWYGRCRSFGVVGGRAYLSGPVAKLFEREVIGDFRFDRSFSCDEDALFVFAVSRNIHRIELTSPKATYYRRIRRGSATTTYMSLGGRVKHYVRKSCAFIKIWSRAPRSYNFLLLLTRLAAGLKTVIRSKKI